MIQPGFETVIDKTLHFRFKSDLISTTMSSSLGNPLEPALAAAMFTLPKKEL